MVVSSEQKTPALPRPCRSARGAVLRPPRPLCTWRLRAGWRIMRLWAVGIFRPLSAVRPRS